MPSAAGGCIDGGTDFDGTTMNLKQLDLLRNHYFQYFRHHPRFGHGKVTPVDRNSFEEILERESVSAKDAFLHVGMHSVRRAFPGQDAFAYVIDSLSRRFRSLIVPGFTPEFRSLGIYHKMFSRPSVDNGIFNVLFYERCTESRTNDCIHNLLVKGDYSFDDCNHQDSFSEDGCFGKLSRDKVLCMNIGTTHIRAAQFHYLERVCGVPYSHQRVHKGVIYYNERDHERVEQTSYEFSMRTDRNWGKIERYLIADGAARKYCLNGFSVLCFNLEDFEFSLRKAIKRAPFFIVD